MIKTTENHFRKVAPVRSWENDVRLAARTPHLASIARTSKGTVLVTSHLSELAWQIAVEENSAAWARLIIEGLTATGNSAEITAKVPMGTYKITSMAKCPKPKTIDLASVVNYEVIAEKIVSDALIAMRRK